MVEVRVSPEEESHPTNPMKNEEGNLGDGKIWLNLNMSQNNNPSQL